MALGKALGDPIISVASGAFTLDPKAVCFLRFWTRRRKPWPGLLRRRRGLRFAAFLDSRRRRRRSLRGLRFAGLLQRRRLRRPRLWRRWWALAQAEEVVGPRLRRRGFPRRIRWRHEGLCRRRHAGRRRRHFNHGWSFVLCCKVRLVLCNMQYASSQKGSQCNMQCSCHEHLCQA